MRYERFLPWNDIIYHQKKNNALERKFEGWRIGIKKTDYPSRTIGSETFKLKLKSEKIKSLKYK